MCVCSLRYPACSAHTRTPYCHMWPAPLYSILPHYLTMARFSGKKGIEHEMFVLVFCTTFISNISHSKKHLLRYHKCTRVCLHVYQYRLFVSHFDEPSISSTDFRKNAGYQVSRKSIQWESSCSVRTDGWTDVTEITVAFPSFANASKMAAIAPQSANYSRSVILCINVTGDSLCLCPSNASYSQVESVQDPS